MSVLSIQIESTEDRNIGDSIANISIRDDKGHVQITGIRVWNVSELCKKLEVLIVNFIDDNV